MRPDGNKNDCLSVDFKNRAIISGDIDTAAIGERLIDRMVLKHHVKRIAQKDIETFIKLRLDFWWQAFKFLFETFMK